MPRISAYPDGGVMLSTDKLVVARSGLNKSIVGSSLGISAHVSNSTNQATTSGAFLTLAWDTEEWDTAALHDIVTNNSRLTIPAGQDGKYDIIAEVEFAAHVTGRRAIVIIQNGLTTLATSKTMTVSDVGATTCIQCVARANLVAGNYIEIQAFQASGGGLNVLTGVNTWATIAKL